MFLVGPRGIIKEDRKRERETVQINQGEKKRHLILLIEMKTRYIFPSCCLSFRPSHFSTSLKIPPPPSCVLQGSKRTRRRRRLREDFSPDRRIHQGEKWFRDTIYEGRNPSLMSWWSGPPGLICLLSENNYASFCRLLLHNWNVNYFSLYFLGERESKREERHRGKAIG